MPARIIAKCIMPFCVCLATALPATAEPRFENYDIRVIRPRFFVKSARFETSAGLGAIVNQTFIYSFVATGLLTYHFNEALALEAQVGYALNADRDDKSTLDSQFAIKTILLRPETLANARVVWTPSYGKFHLSSSEIVYFDTHVTVGAGLTGISYLYDHCESPSEAPTAAQSRVPEPPSPETVQYPTVVLGIGQRYFLSKSSSLRFGFELQRFRADAADGACGEQDGESRAIMSDNALFFSAWSYYL